MDSTFALSILRYLIIMVRTLSQHSGMTLANRWMSKQLLHRSLEGKFEGNLVDNLQSSRTFRSRSGAHAGNLGKGADANVSGGETIADDRNTRE